MKLKLRKSLSNNGWVKLEDNVEIQIDYPTIEQQRKLEDLMFVNMDNPNAPNSFKFYKSLVKFCLKNWKGVEEPCKLDGDELSEETMNLILDPMNIIELGRLINEEIKFMDIDKKK